MRKKILFITTVQPFPPISGAKLRTFFLIKMLSGFFDILFIYIGSESLNIDAKKFLEKNTKENKIFIYPRFRFFLNVLYSLVNKYPLQVNYYYFKDVQEFINKKENDVDLVFCSLIRSAKYLLNVKKTKVIDLTDSIALNYKNSIKNCRSLFWKLIYRFEFRRLWKFEKRVIESFNKTTLVNYADAKQFNMPEKILYLPNGVKEELFSIENISPEFKKCITFFGAMNYQPNIDAVLWFCENVLELLNCELTFLIIGSNPGRNVLQLQNKYQSVKVKGYLENPYTILKSSLCVVAPMQTGGGIQNKILESMALGSIVLTTSFAAKAIEGAQNNRDFIVMDSPSDFSNTIHNLYANPNGFDFIKKNARNFIMKNYTWERYEKDLISMIEEELNKQSLKPLTV